MGFFRRSRAQKDRDFRAIGREVALGIVAPELVDVSDNADEHVDADQESAGLHCGTCGSPGRIDMIDTTVRLAYLTCRRCGRTWETDRASVPAAPFFSRSE